ncbi:O-antigen ligase family protein [Vibrio tapetis]|uniref:Lipid A core-O-antigen ligase n=1 Tax=Vibrio tapetis subsp. tapetis TaxID=1671868 RepID=A0A2N8ZLK1_9VIBR|nr:O-antigen ligase family protein [Vibrio tapetis]SON52780.1 Lipid A core-O-antigen ligase [Vibrio tapetis subsp. tapetis]
MRTLERLLFVSLLALLIWLPIPLGSNRSWAWFIAESWIIVQVLGLLAFYKGRLPWQYLARFSSLLIPFAIFQCWVFIQTIPLPFAFVEFFSPTATNIYTEAGSQHAYFSLDSSHTQTALVKGICYCLFLFNSILLVNSSSRLKYAVIALVISGTFQAFYAAIVVLLGLEQSLVFGYPEQGVATGSFVYKNHLANYLMLCLCMGVGLIITQLHTSDSGGGILRVKRLLSGILSPKMFIRLAIIIMVIALVMTRSRMGNIAFFFATTTVGLLALFIYKQKPKALTALIFSVLAIDTIIVGILFGLNEVKQRIVSTSLDAESRDQVITWSLDIIRDFPLTGTGMASFYAVFPGYSKADVGFYDHAHNEFIQFAVEAGVPATLLLGCAVAFAMYKSLRVQSTRNSKMMKGVAIGCSMSIVGMLVHISVDFNLQPMANAVTFLFILFLAHAVSILPNERTKVGQKNEFINEQQ